MNSSVQLVDVTTPILALRGADLMVERVCNIPQHHVQALAGERAAHCSLRVRGSLRSCCLQHEERLAHRFPDQKERHEVVRSKPWWREGRFNDTNKGVDPQVTELHLVCRSCETHDNTWSGQTDCH